MVARKTATATPRFKIVFAGNGANPFNVLEHETPVAGTTDVMGPTAFGHNGGADAMSVGASDVRVATNLNSYSSYGPVTTLFGPVNGVTPAAPLASPKVVAKPDLVASDCNVTTFFAGAGPPFHFCGTSAAAPHAAAVAALLWQKFPTATMAQINTAMISTATPIAGVPGSFQGGGLLNALAASNALVAPPPPPPPAPDTTITNAPKKTVKTTKKKAKVSFQFTSTVAGSTFACSIDGKAFTPCTSGVTLQAEGRQAHLRGAGHRGRGDRPDPGDVQLQGEAEEAPPLERRAAAGFPGNRKPDDLRRSSAQIVRDTRGTRGNLQP